MANEIIKYISRYIRVSKEMEEAVVGSTFIKTFEKGTLLLEEGNISNECYFIFKGCIRSYYVKDGEEKTTDFYTEEEAVTPSAYGKNIPSEYYVECIEETIAGVGTPGQEAEMLTKFPQLESLIRAFGEAVIAKQQDTMAAFKMSSPEELYLHLVKNRADLLQRVPQHQIASYLGIKPESMSRIRKRLAK